MANVLINDTYLKAIGEAIRSKLGTVLKYKPSEMATAINNIQTLKEGGYKVNITQSEHQTITVTQPSFNNRTAGFTIDDYPSINVSLKADPGYTAGSLNHTNFTFSNDVREVDIFATAATYSPNITYNGNMNVFLAQVTGGNMFNITTGTKDDSRVPSFREYTYNEAFALSLVDNGDDSWERLSINCKDNFYNLDPNANYKITAIKIGDTSLSDADISDGSPEISSTTSRGATYINAYKSKDWVKSVYKQCTGKELKKAEIDLSDFSPAVLDIFLQSSSNQYSIKYPGEQIANRISGEPTSELVDFLVLPYEISEFFKTLSSDKKTEFANSVEFFMTSYKTNTTGFRDGNLIQNYFNTLKQFQDRYANDTTATTILEKYDPLKNNIFLDATLNDTSIDIFEIVYKIDSSNTYGFTSSLNGGLAYVLWVFYAYCLIIRLLIMSSSFEPADPIISTIPVSITFTNVTQ